MKEVEAFFFFAVFEEFTPIFYFSRMLLLNVNILSKYN